jgi:leader peptidase (prepilin peptidase)/N-methyltransferase
MIRIFCTGLAALLGLAFGSFLNVCLSRWPEGESVVRPRSHCANCGRTLAWWENIPVASWVALRGRCRTCNVKISWRYPLIEFTIGVLWAIVVWMQLTEIVISTTPAEAVSFSLRFLLQFFVTIAGGMILTWLLVALAALDAEHLWLPNWLTGPGVVLGVVYTATLVAIRYHGSLACWDCASPLEAAGARLLSAALAAALILLIRWAYWLIRRREGIGLGDAKLMATLGAWLGLSGALLSFSIGVFLGAIFALILLGVPAGRRGSETWSAARLPLGTFLCIGGTISALWGQRIIAAYLHWAGL